MSSRFSVGAAKKEETADSTTRPSMSLNLSKATAARNQESITLSSARSSTPFTKKEDATNILSARSSTPFTKKEEATTISSARGSTPFTKKEETTNISSARGSTPFTKKEETTNVSSARSSTPFTTKEDTINSSAARSSTPLTTKEETTNSSAARSSTPFNLSNSSATNKEDPNNPTSARSSKKEETVNPTPARASTPFTFTKLGTTKKEETTKPLSARSATSLSLPPANATKRDDTTNPTAAITATLATSAATRSASSLSFSSLKGSVRARTGGGAETVSNTGSLPSSLRSENTSWSPTKVKTDASPEEEARVAAWQSELDSLEQKQLSIQADQMGMLHSQVHILTRELGDLQAQFHVVRDDIYKKVESMQAEIEAAASEAHAALRLELAEHGSNAEEMKKAWEEAHLMLTQAMDDTLVNLADGNAKALADHAENHGNTIAEIQAQLQGYDEKHAAFDAKHAEQDEKHASSTAAMEAGLENVLASTHDKLQSELAELKSGHVVGNMKQIVTDITQQVDNLALSLEQEATLRRAVEEKLDKMFAGMCTVIETDFLDGEDDDFGPDDLVLN